jgi:hypothetical protein
MKTYKCPSCLSKKPFDSEYKLKEHVKRKHLYTLRFEYSTEASRIYYRWAGGDNNYEEMLDEVDEMGYERIRDWPYS